MDRRFFSCLALLLELLLLALTMLILIIPALHLHGF